LETFLDLELPELLGKRTGAMKACEICARLGLDEHRGWKFLHCTALAGLLTEKHGERCDSTVEYELSDAAKEYFGASGDTDDGYYFRDLVNYWRYLNDLPISLVDVLRGADLPDMVQWPPKTSDAAAHLEYWMRVTAGGAVATLLASGAMEGATSILDVGGGDGSVDIGVVKAVLQKNSSMLPCVTVFNLPASAALAVEHISAHGLEQHISVVAGDFLKDELPGGFDRVLFSRVLTDWTPTVCRMLLEKARRALKPGGKLVINEAFAEGNGDYCTAWEYRYIFYDTFGRYLFKPLSVYEKLLQEAGFRVVSVSPMLDEAFYSVVVAEPV
jgi:ubiquinone/menaquinone biosynthesis C-methylase UbiE